MDVHAHDRFSQTLRLSETEISAFAQAAGDANPLHRDVAFARRSRYGQVIASGPQSTSLLMGLAATHFSRIGPMVGLEFSFFFRAAVPAEALLKLDWLVVRVSPTSSRAAAVVELRGRLRIAEGETAVGARGRVLVSRHPPATAA
jgi:acyl dehydratase